MVNQSRQIIRIPKRINNNGYNILLSTDRLDEPAWFRAKLHQQEQTDEIIPDADENENDKLWQVEVVCEFRNEKIQICNNEEDIDAERTTDIPKDIREIRIPKAYKVFYMYSSSIYTLIELYIEEYIDELSVVCIKALDDLFTHYVCADDYSDREDWKDQIYKKVDDIIDVVENTF